MVSENVIDENPHSGEWRKPSARCEARCEKGAPAPTERECVGPESVDVRWGTNGHSSEVGKLIDQKQFLRSILTKHSVKKEGVGWRAVKEGR